MTSAGARPTIFLSYASQDRPAVRVLRDALPGLGLEVWYDENELGGGDAWDQKIRRQIRDCDYFMPIVSAQTEARAEGYFRREWRLAVERTLDMADDHLFLLPVVIDATNQSTARVPERFLAVQWLTLPGGQPTAALEALCRRLTSGSGAPLPATRELATRVDGRVATSTPRVAGHASPVGPLPFPREEPGRKMKFWVQVGGWGVRAAWLQFKRLPRWVRVGVYVWIAILLVARCDQSDHEATTELSPANVAKLKAIAEKYKSSTNHSDLVNLGADIAQEFTEEEPVAADGSPLLAIPFTAPAGDAGAEKLANSAFALAYGMVSISHPGAVAMTKEPLVSHDLGAAVERGHATHSTYVLRGSIAAVPAASLTIDIVRVADGVVLWSKSYPTAGADPAKIAAEVDAHVPPLDAKAAVGAKPSS